MYSLCKLWPANMNLKKKLHQVSAQEHEFKSIARMHTTYTSSYKSRNINILASLVFMLCSTAREKLFGLKLAFHRARVWSPVCRAWDQPAVQNSWMWNLYLWHLGRPPDVRQSIHNANRASVIQKISYSALLLVWKLWSLVQAWLSIVQTDMLIAIVSLMYLIWPRLQYQLCGAWFTYILWSFMISRYSLLTLQASTIAASDIWNKFKNAFWSSQEDLSLNYSAKRCDATINLHALFLIILQQMLLEACELTIFRTYQHIELTYYQAELAKQKSPECWKDVFDSWGTGYCLAAAIVGQEGSFSPSASANNWLGWQRSRLTWLLFSCRGSEERLQTGLSKWALPKYLYVPGFMAPAVVETFLDRSPVNLAWAALNWFWSLLFEISGRQQLSDSCWKFCTMLCGCELDCEIQFGSRLVSDGKIDSETPVLLNLLSVVAPKLLLPTSEICRSRVLGYHTGWLWLVPPMAIILSLQCDAVFLLHIFWLL